MKIKTINIKDLYCFHHTKINFCPGVNVIFGPTGADKQHLESILKFDADYFFSHSKIRKVSIGYYSTHPFSKRHKIDLQYIQTKCMTLINRFLREYYWVRKEDSVEAVKSFCCYANANAFISLLANLLEYITNFHYRISKGQKYIKAPSVVIASDIFDQFDLETIIKLMKIVRFLAANGAQVFIFCTHLTSIRQLWLELKGNTNIPYRFISLAKNETYRTTVSESDDINNLEWDHSVLDEQCKQDEQLLEIFSHGI